MQELLIGYKWIVLEVAHEQARIENKDELEEKLEKSIREEIKKNNYSGVFKTNVLVAGESVEIMASWCSVESFDQTNDQLFFIMEFEDL